jgi:hypothetical protein
MLFASLRRQRKSNPLRSPRAGNLTRSRDLQAITVVAARSHNINMKVIEGARIRIDIES